MSTKRRLTRRALLQACGVTLGLKAAHLRGLAIGADVTESSPCAAFAHTSYPPLLERFIQKLDPANDDLRTEQYCQEIERVLSAWSEALRQSVHHPGVLGESLLEDVSGSTLIPSESKGLRGAGALRIERRAFNRPEVKGRSPFLVGWSSYLAPLASIETAEFEIYGIRVSGELPLRVETEVRCDLVGDAVQGGREQRAGSWSIAWIQKEQRWFVQRWVVHPEVRSYLSGPGFVEISALSLNAEESGIRQLARSIDDWRTELDAACGIDIYGNHGIACGDIAGDGFDGFYVCQPSGLPNRLFKNRGDGTFEDITDLSGTGILDGTASALFVDFLNRGRQDLLVVRSGGPLLFSNEGNGHFIPKPEAFQFKTPPQGTFTSAAVADYDLDGFLDIYFCVYSYYQGLNQYSFPAPYYDAQNGPPNFLFRNLGNGSFEDVTASSGVDQNNNRFSFAAAWCDYDNDGRPDLYVANDFGRKNLYRNTRDGKFADVAHQAGVEDYGPGMSVCWLDYDNDGLQDVYVANMWLNEGKRITANENFLPDAPESIRALYRKHNAGNSLYKNNGRGGFLDKTSEAGSAMARWSWSCAAWDFDHDGFDDLYVANGFVSGPNHDDLQSFFWRQIARRSLGAPGASPDYEMAWNAVNELVRSGYSWSGYERNVFYANNRDGTFSDVSGTLGLDFRDDSRAYALTDLDHDGRFEIILKNRTGPQIRVLANEIKSIGNSVTFRLTGRTSNRDAIGAMVTIESGGRHQSKFISAGSGFASQHTKELHFGLGDSADPLSISIRWPKGKVERHEHIPVNCRVEIEEGSAHVKATPFELRKKGIAQSAGGLVTGVEPGTVSTWMISPVFGPNSALEKLQSENRKLGAMKFAPRLLSFFRVGCDGSKQQIQELQKSSEYFAAGELPVAAVALPSNPDGDEVVEFARAMNLSFPVVIADEKAAGAWNVFYRFLFDRRRDLQAPTSFLLDKTGAVIRIYRGFVDGKTILNDWRSAPASSSERFARALPFKGPYFGNPMSHNYFTDGIAFVEYGYVDEARDAFQRVVDADPSHASAWFNLGTIYLQKKMSAEARKCLSESVRLNPQDADAWNNLGMISGESGDYNRALEEFRRASIANPNHALAVQNMMRIFQFQARPADAQKALEDLISRAPGNAGLHLAYGMALVAQNQMPAALSELQTAVRLGPNNPDALNDLGALLMRIGRSQEAQEWFERCQRIAPDSDRPVLNLSILYTKAGQSEKARRLLEDFSTKHPDNIDVRNALGRLVSN